jgi:ADP-Ribosyltransferase in polyvalent proteins
MEDLPEGFTLDTPGLPSGFTLDPPEPEQKDKYPTLAAAADVPLSFGRGVVGGIQMIADAFGADSSASKALQSADTYLADLMSAQSKKDSAEISRIMQEAQDKGVLDQVKAGLKALSVAPVDILTNALGTAAPTIVAGLAAAVGAPAVATAAGASAATAAAVGTGAGIAAELGVGAISGAGTIKNRIYGDVKQTLLDKGVPEDRAEAAAQEAQSYNGKNLDSILLGALFGAGASVTGVERTGVKALASKILGNAAKESAEVVAARKLAEAAGETAPLRFTKGFVKEAIPEAGQEAQEQVASNIALQREGEDVPTFRGAAGAATLAGIAGGLLGGGLDVAVGPSARTIHPQQEDRALIDALKTIEDYKKPEEFFRLAEENRDTVPVLGEILDSGVSQDKKLELIMKRLGEIGLQYGPQTVIEGGGPRSLPAPQGERPTRPGVSEFYNAAIDKGAPLTDLSINQGPNGFRILSGSENVIADGINSERDANVLLEGLRRAYDENNFEKYRNMLSVYDEQRRKIETEALAKAGSETKTPLRPVTMSDLRELADEEDRHIVPMIQMRRQRTGQDLEGDITIAELREMGASKTLIDELMREQKPYSMGTGKVKPGLVEEELGPRPSAPSLTARTEAELEKAKAKGRLLNTGNFPEIDTEFARAGRKEAPQAVKQEQKPVVYPKFEDVQKARALVEERLTRLEKKGDQGVAIAKGVREAMGSNEFDPNQLSHAFALADISANLLGDTKGVHDLKFVNRLMTYGGEEVQGSRTKPRENINGLIQLSLAPNSLLIGRQTSAHEAFHVLQDLFAENDKQASNVIKGAFKGAQSFDDIDANLLRTLKRMKDPDSNKSLYDRLKASVTQDVLDSYDQAQREREMQAYVFGAFDDAIRRGRQQPAGLGSAFVRFLNYFRNFVTRAGNYFRGQGFQTAEDVMRETTAGTRQAGKAQAGARVTTEATPAAEEYSSVGLRRGTQTLKKYGVERNATGVKTRRLAEALEARQRERYGVIDRNDYSSEAANRIANWMADEVTFADEQQKNGVDSGVGWYSGKYQRALDAFSQIFPELRTDKNKRDIFTAVVAIMSDGQKVYNNFSLAGRAYSEYRSTGRFPETFAFGGERRVSMETNLAAMNSLLDLFNGDERAVINYLMEERTVSELKRVAREDGINFSTAYKADTRLPMAALVFGPKLGAFFSNLMGSHGYLTMDRWWSRTFNRYRGQLVTRVIGTSDKPFNSKGEPIGLARFKVLLAKHDRRNSPWTTISDREALARLQDFRDAYEAKGYKNGTEIEKAANTIYKAAFEGTEDQPFNASDRSFMIYTANRAQQILKRRGIDLSLADIQAVLWYYEKRLYGELGARQTADISYEEAATRVVNDHRDNPGRWVTHDAPETTVVGPDGSLIEVGDEEPEFDEGLGEEEFSRAAAQTGENVEEFKKWWGDSKAVTNNGAPMPYYHGTFKKFKKFAKAKSAAIVGEEGPFFFSPKPRLASDFAMTDMSKSGSGAATKGGRVIPVFLSVQDPFDFQNPSHIKRLLNEVGLDRDLVREIQTGSWNALEARDVQEGIKNAGFDGFYVKEGGIKNLAVYDPKQIKGVFNQFAPGTAESEEFSRAIASTGQQQEAEVNASRFSGMFDGIREFFKPFALVKNVEELFELRNISMGTITKSEQFARKMSKIIGGASQVDRDAVYKFMTTRNADPSTISNNKIRDAAVQSKKEINLLAKKMIEEGQLTQESFDEYYDQYLPRLYLYYELTGRGMKTPLGGKSVQEYLKARNNELSEEDRAILGEIKDPAFLVYVALSRPARDLAMIKYLNNIYAVGEENGWIAPQTTVEWRGNKMTPYDLNHRAEEMRRTVLKTLREQDSDQADIMEKEIFKMKEIADEGIRQVGSAIKRHELEGFKQMPDNPRYGPLAGAVVKKAIFNDLVGTFVPLGRDNMSLAEKLVGDENSSLVKLNQLWKLGKTTLNPPTQVTNAISNAIALNVFGGVPLHQFPRLFKVALDGILKNSEQWNDAQDFGLQGGTMSAAELRAAVTRLKAYQFKSGEDTSLIGMFASVRSIMSAVAEGATDAYQFSETLFKFMHYIHEIEKAGPNPTSRQKSNAVNAAHDTLFDYSLVNPNIRYIRNSPIGIPFITYYYKALPKLIETMVKTPWRFIPYVALAYALPMATMAAFDLDDDELEKLRKSMADYIRDSGSLYILPMRDSKGNIQFIDVGRFFPFSTFIDPLITAFRYGEYGKAAKEAYGPFLPSGPLVTAITVLNSGVDPFTKKKIYDERDTPKAQALSMLSYVWNQALPPAISVDFNNMEQSGGAIPRIYNSLFVDGTGVDRRGLPKPEVMESMLRIFGVNITPLDATRQAYANMTYMQNQIIKTKSLQTQVARDQSLTPQARTQKIRELADEIKKDMLKLEEYANSVSGVGAVAEKIRKAQ